MGNLLFRFDHNGQAVIPNKILKSYPDFISDHGVFISIQLLYPTTADGCYGYKVSYVNPDYEAAISDIEPLQDSASIHSLRGAYYVDQLTHPITSFSRLISAIRERFKGFGIETDVSFEPDFKAAAMAFYRFHPPFYPEEKAMAVCDQHFFNSKAQVTVY